jgi:hypothetical protein
MKSSNVCFAANHVLRDVSAVIGIVFTALSLLPRMETSAELLFFGDRAEFEAAVEGLISDGFNDWRAGDDRSIMPRDG